MADKVTVWFDAEADYLEVQFKRVPGYMKETAHERVNGAWIPKATSSGLVFSA